MSFHLIVDDHILIAAAAATLAAPFQFVWIFWCGLQSCSELPLMPAQNTEAMSGTHFYIQVHIPDMMRNPYGDKKAMMLFIILMEGTHQAKGQ